MIKQNIFKYSLIAGFILLSYNIFLIINTILLEYNIKIINIRGLYSNYIIYIIIMLLILTTYFIYLNGFIELSRIYKNKLLFYVSYIWIIYTICQIIIEYFSAEIIISFLIIANDLLLIALGIISILWGIALIKIKKFYEEYCKIIGITIITTGIVYVLFVNIYTTILIYVIIFSLELSIIYLALNKKLLKKNKQKS